MRARFAAWPTGVLVIGFSVAGLLSAGATNEIGSPKLAQACVWRTAASQDPHRSLYDRFDSVAAVSPREAWAVGNYFTGHEGGPNGAFVARWNGRRWRVAAAPIPRGAILSSVAASGTGDVWAVGWRPHNAGTLIEHWDGLRWHIVAAAFPPGGILNGVVALTPHDAWAVGTYFGHRAVTLIEHWDGRRWTVTPSPRPHLAPGRRPYAVLQAVTAISPTDVWAVGYSGTEIPATSRTLTEHWDGRRWTIVPSPNVRSPRSVTNNILFSISGSRRDNLWAVGSWGSVAGGYGGKGDHALTLHWDGRRWSRIAVPALGERALLSGVAARARQGWAVGDRGPQPHPQTLIERWDGARWSVFNSPGGSGFSATSIELSGRGAWAVGANGRKPLAARC